MIAGENCLRHDPHCDDLEDQWTYLDEDLEDQLTTRVARNTVVEKYFQEYSMGQK